MNALHHITMNTGNVVQHELAQFRTRHTASVLDSLEAACPITHGHGEWQTATLPRPFHQFRCRWRAASGHAVFELLGRSADAIVSNVVCWDPGASETAWTAAEEIAQPALRDWPEPVTVTLRRPESPWLATVLHRNMASLDREDVAWIGDWEKCMAAAALRAVGKL